jgi:hypothetical protein
VVWAGLTVGAMLAGPVWVAVLVTPVSALAAASATRSWQVSSRMRDGRRPARPALPTAPMAAGAAGLITLAAAVGLLAAATLAVITAAGIVAGTVLGPRGAPDATRRVLIVLLPAGAGAALVLSRSLGLSAGLVLAGTACLYDAGAYLIGTGARTVVEGPIAGLANVAALTLLVAAVLVPPFRGDSPWILGGLAAVLAPIGPFVARGLIGDPLAQVPALRRLDSLLVLGPAWALVASVLLRP